MPYSGYSYCYPSSSGYYAGADGSIAQVSTPAGTYALSMAPLPSKCPLGRYHREPTVTVFNSWRPDNVNRFVSVWCPGTRLLWQVAVASRAPSVGTAVASASPCPAARGRVCLAPMEPQRVPRSVRTVARGTSATRSDSSCRRAQTCVRPADSQRGALRTRVRRARLGGTEMLRACARPCALETAPRGTSRTLNSRVGDVPVLSMICGCAFG
jgi:hypothetical protein